MAASARLSASVSWAGPVTGASPTDAVTRTLHPLEPDRRGDGLGESAGGVLDPAPVDCGAGEQPGELVAAEAGDEVVPGEAGEPVGHTDQHLVAGGVPVPVVDLLEVVEVEHHGDQRLAGRVGEQGGRQAVEGAPVGQPGEWVVTGGVPLGGELGLKVIDLGLGAHRPSA